MRLHGEQNRMRTVAKSLHVSHEDCVNISVCRTRVSRYEEDALATSHEDILCNIPWKLLPLGALDSNYRINVMKM